MMCELLLAFVLTYIRIPTCDISFYHVLSPITPSPPTTPSALKSSFVQFLITSSYKKVLLTSECCTFGLTASVIGAKLENCLFVSQCQFLFQETDPSLLNAIGDLHTLL